MSWSTELWDQFDNISSHTSKGIDFLDRFGQFIKDRCMIELEYATKLRKLAKNHDFKSKKDEEELEFTYCRAFRSMLREIADMAGQHELIAENMSVQIVKEIVILSKDLREERKRHLNEGLRLQTNLNSSLNQLDKSKKSYDKAFKESEKAHENFLKADADLNLSRAEVERSRSISMAKEQQCEDYKTEYAKQLQTANNCQREHYNQLMPKIFQQLQDMEDRRIECAKNFIKSSAIIQRNVAPIIDKCLQGIIDCGDQIDAKSDCQLVIDRYKSGMQPPDDIPFEDLSNPKPIEQQDQSSFSSDHNNSSNTYQRGSTLGYSHSLKSDSLRHTLSARGLKKRSKLFGIFGYNKQDFVDLPPNQKRKKILARIQQLQTQINQENAVREGLMNMRQAYAENAAFGDPMTIETNLQENHENLKRLKSELDKFESLLSELNSTIPANFCNSNNNTLNSLSTNSSLNSTSNGADNQNSDTSFNISSKSRVRNSRNMCSSETGSTLSRTNSENSLRPSSLSGGIASGVGVLGVATNDVITTPTPTSPTAHDSNSNSNSKSKSNTTTRTSNSFNDSSTSDSISNALGAGGNCSDAVDGGARSSNSLPYADAESEINVETQDEDCDPEDFPAQGSAKALYDFKAEPAGSISMSEGEQFDIIESDQGDGWTRVRRNNYQRGDQDFIGFVPTSYLEIHPLQQESNIATTAAETAAATTNGHE